MIFTDLWDSIPPADEDIDGFHHYPVEVKKFKRDPADRHYTLIWDFPGDDNNWPGSYKCFLYEDKRILGHFHYVKEAKMDDEKVDGTYTMYADKLRVHGHFIADGEKCGGLHMFLTTKK